MGRPVKCRACKSWHDPQKGCPDPRDRIYEPPEEEVNSPPKNSPADLPRTANLPANIPKRVLPTTAQRYGAADKALLKEAKAYGVPGLRHIMAADNCTRKIAEATQKKLIKAKKLELARAAIANGHAPSVPMPADDLGEEALDATLFKIGAIRNEVDVERRLRLLESAIGHLSDRYDALETWVLRQKKLANERQERYRNRHRNGQ